MLKEIKYKRFKICEERVMEINTPPFRHPSGRGEFRSQFPSFGRVPERQGG